MSPVRLIAMLCAAQVLVQIGAFFWPALLPEMIARWRLTNSEAGWITAAFYGAYMLAVPVLVTLTDRIDAKRVYLGGVAAMILGHALFAALADGFWSAFIARSLTGIGWAGTYMTGLKLLADKVDAKTLSRAAAAHAASIGVSGALSYVCADLLANAGGWRFAFAAASASAGVRVANRGVRGAAPRTQTGRCTGWNTPVRLQAGAAKSIGDGLRDRLWPSHARDGCVARLGCGVSGLRCREHRHRQHRDFSNRDADGLGVAWDAREPRGQRGRDLFRKALAGFRSHWLVLSRSRCCSRCSACSLIRWRSRSCWPTAR